MIRRLLLVVGIIVSLSSCGGDIAYRIEGKLTNLEDQTLYAVFENEDIKVVDTVTCGKPGEFLIEKKQGDFREVTIFFADKMHWVTAYLEKGDKVKVTLRFRGREMAHMYKSKYILDDFAESLADIAVVDKPSKVEGRSMVMFLTAKR